MKRLSLLLLLVLLLTGCVGPFSQEPRVTDVILPADAPNEAPPATTASGEFVPAAPADTSITITDALGRTVTLPALPQRIAMAGKGVIMLADAAYTFPDAGTRLVALAKTDQGLGNFQAALDPTFATKTILDNQAGVEAIVATRPDLVILKTYSREPLGDPLEALGIPVIYLGLELPEQYAADLTTLGQVFGQPERAAAVQTCITDRQEAVAAALQDLPDAERPSALLLYYSSKDGAVAFNVPPAGWIQTQLVQAAGGAPVWLDSQPGDGWIKVNLEQIAAWNPEHIFLTTYNQDVRPIAAQLAADPQWAALQAVQSGNLHPVPADYYSWDQPDVRWPLALTWMAARLHPDRYDPDLPAEIDAYFGCLYGLEPEAVQALLAPVLKGDW
jgi:iron complex transport system substrate-binding protein